MKLNPETRIGPHWVSQSFHTITTNFSKSKERTRHENMKTYIFKKVINLITFNLFYTQNDLVCILVLILPETIIPDSHSNSTSTKNAKKATILR